MSPFDPNSRELEARTEMSVSHQTRAVTAVLVIGFLLLLAVGPGLETEAIFERTSEIFAPVTPRPRASAGARAALSWATSTIDEIEARFDERSRLVKLVRPTAQMVLTRYGRYGNERVIVGRDGWLFFRDDIEHLIGSRKGAEYSGDPAAAILALHRELTDRGMVLLLVPTPLKPTVHLDKLSRRNIKGALRRGGERRLLGRLEAAGVEVLDLADRFARDAELGPLYLATDTHWRPEAVEIAARETAVRLREISALPPGRELDADEPLLAREARGDTASLLNLRRESDVVPTERVEIHPTGDRESAAAPVLLLGDSFSAIYSNPGLGWGSRAGFGERLEHHLGLPVKRIVRTAGGASATRAAFAEEIRSHPDRFSGLRAVVWQFAAREISQGDWRVVDLSKIRP